MTLLIYCNQRSIQWYKFQAEILRCDSPFDLLTTHLCHNFAFCVSAEVGGRLWGSRWALLWLQPCGGPWAAVLRGPWAGLRPSACLRPSPSIIRQLINALYIIIAILFYRLFEVNPVLYWIVVTILKYQCDMRLLRVENTYILENLRDFTV